MEKQLDNKISSSTKWSFVGEVIAKLITPVTSMVLARVLTPDAFGIIAAINMIISFADIFKDAGFQKYLIQHNFRSKKDLYSMANVAFISNIFLSLIIVGIIFIFREQIATLVGCQGLGNVISIASIQIFLTSISSIQTSLYRKNFEFKKLFYFRIVTAFIPLIITVPVAYITRSYWALIIGNLSSALTNSILLTIFSEWKPTFYFSFSLLREMFSFGIWNFGENIAIWLTSWIDTMLIGNTFSQYYLGIYKNSLNLVNSCMALITASIIPVLYSAFSSIQNDEQEFKKVYFYYQKIIAFVLFPIGILIFSFKDMITLILLGSQWREASDIIGIWGLMCSISIVFNHINGEVYRAKGRADIAFIYQVIHLCFLIPTCLLSIKFGFWTLVYARSLIKIQGILTGFVFMNFFFKIRYIEMFNAIKKPAILAIVFALITSVFSKLSNDLLIEMVTCIGLCSVYLILLKMFFTEDWKNIVQFIRGGKKK